MGTSTLQVAWQSPNNKWHQSKKLDPVTELPWTRNIDLVDVSFQIPVQTTLFPPLKNKLILRLVPHFWFKLGDYEEMKNHFKEGGEQSSLKKRKQQDTHKPTKP